MSTETSSPPFLLILAIAAITLTACIIAIALGVPARALLAFATLACNISVVGFLFAGRDDA